MRSATTLTTWNEYHLPVIILDNKIFLCAMIHLQRILTLLTFRLYIENVDVFQVELSSVISIRKSSSDLHKLRVHFSLR